MAETSLTKEYVNSILLYEKDTGVLRWRNQQSNRVKPNSVAGSINSEGYVCLDIRARPYRAHRIIWLMEYGNFPNGQIDHIDGNRANNRLENLREVSNKQNQENKKTMAKSVSGHKGVTWHSRDKVWQARIGHNMKSKHLGSFRNVEDAISAYKEAALQIHTCNNV